MRFDAGRPAEQATSSDGETKNTNGLEDPIARSSFSLALQFGESNEAAESYRWLLCALRVLCGDRRLTAEA
jgi:hypothetical protein